MNAMTWVLAFVAWAAASALLLKLRRWLLFYLIGAFGFVLLITFGLSLIGLDTVIEAAEARQVAAMARGLGVGVQVAGTSGLAIPSSGGWAVFDIGLECSAILEMLAIISITVFYPAFSAPRKAAYATIGLFVTFIVNLLRILLIVAIVSALGTSWVFAAHAVFGRVFFFVATVLLYWGLVTRPTVSFTNRLLEKGSLS